MPTFIYKAVSPQGTIVKNKVDDASKLSCIRKLKRNGLTPISVTQTLTITKGGTKSQRKNIKSASELQTEMLSAKIAPKRKSQQPLIEKIDKALMSTEKITSRDIRVFTQNFYLLKKANFNNIHALSTVIETTENPKFKTVLEDILSGVESGEFMYTTMEYYSNIFPYIYINMIKVGELSGSLTNSLQQAVKYLEESDALNRKLKSILIPNIVQFVLLLVMLFAGTLIAIPTIQGIFDELGTEEELPAITLWFADVVDVMIAYWYIPVVLLAIVAAGVIFYINTPKGKYNFHYFKYKMPIFGDLIFALDFSRFLKAMLLNLRNGMRIQDSIEVSKNVVKNYVMLSMIETSINNILTGTSWIEPFEESGLAKPMITEMLKIGMQTDLAEMMEKLVEYMQIDIDNIMEKIMKVLPQVVYAVVGVVLIFFVLVVLVPCIQVYMGNFLFSAYGV